MTNDEIARLRHDKDISKVKNDRELLEKHLKYN